MSLVEAMPTSRARMWVVAVVTTCCMLLTLLSSGIALASGKALNLSTDRENEAHDGNENTSANILNDDGYITFDLGDLQIDASTGLSYTAGQANGWSASVVREFLRDDLTRIQASSVTISGWKADYSAAVPTDAAYVRFTALSGAIICFYEVGPILGGGGGASTTSLNRSAERENEAHDGNENTSANILSDDGYITFSLDDLQINAGTGLRCTAGQANGGSACVVREFLKDDLTRIGASTVIISGWKTDYAATVPADASYVRFTALSGAIICFHEIGPIMGGGGGASSTSWSLSTERESEAHDGNENTSANILNDNGYITFSLGHLQIDDSTGLRYTVGQANGGSASAIREFLKDDLTRIEASTVIISGWKADYAATVPADAAYVRFTALSGAIVCFYEVGPIMGGGGGASSTSWSLSTDRESEACDGNENTSANILNNEGYITFKLDHLQIDASTGLLYTVGQANGGSASVARAFLRADLTQIEASTVTISGWKADYAEAVPADAAYVRFTALGGAIICFYEVGPVISLPSRAVMGPPPQ